MVKSRCVARSGPSYLVKGHGHRASLIASSPASHKSLSGPKCSGECPRVSLKTRVSEGVFHGVSLEPGPQGPRRPVRHSLGHPPFSRTLLGTLPGTIRARRAQETPVAGRGVHKSLMLSKIENGEDLPNIAHSCQNQLDLITYLGQV